MENQGIMANGDIAPSRFVALDPTEDFRCVQAAAGNTVVIGISLDNIRTHPHTESTETRHAMDGEHVQIHRPGQFGKVAAGAAIVRGAYLKPDANGKAITATTGNVAFARAWESAGAADETPIVEVMFPFVIP
jgi:hypothetical protein